VITVTVEYSDDCPAGIETWPDAYKHEHDARRFAEIMARRRDVKEIRVETACAKHGSHDYDDSRCDLCGFYFCTDDLRDCGDGKPGHYFCTDCRDDMS
jgi:hypothetical protein